VASRAADPRLRWTCGALACALAACVAPGNQLREPPAYVPGASLVQVELGEAPVYATRHRYRAEGGLEADLRVMRVTAGARPEGAPPTPAQREDEARRQAALDRAYWDDAGCASDGVDPWGRPAADVARREPRRADRPWTPAGAPTRCRRPDGWTARWTFTVRGGDRLAVLRIDAPLPAPDAQPETIARVERLARALLAPMLPTAGG
jgi:hypothetical protein